MIAVQVASAAAPDQPFAIVPAELDEPREHEVLVRIVGVGICHTDLYLKASTGFTPGVLGHEGSGVVERVGSAVTRLIPGDHVVLSYFACHHCATCDSGHTAYCPNAFVPNYSGGRADGSKPITIDGQPVPCNLHYQSSFATYALAHENNAIKVDSDLPLALLGPLGCGLLTGAGTVIHALKVGHGHSIAVFGVGSVGLAAIMAAKAVGASTIIAVDLNAGRLEEARRLGATHLVKGDEQDAVKAIQDAVPGGVDFSLECVGSPKLLRQAVDGLNRLGTCALLGVPQPGAEVSLDMVTLLSGRTVVGLIEGDCDPQVFIPKMIDLYRAGSFPFDSLIRLYPFAQINEAIADMKSGKTIKPVLQMN